ncbi:gluconate 2-dehydrogenase subunit 3 family protein [Aureimonas phyllosphaerae]|uniref:Gluconate 2-dehydrogenase gamma chain n=1 Tax=Aureimonas phyllosphaerae TaxID=1166078 RepID=A0A7W6FWA1_9HYPH|nr:gluconate 2-dehydrogenase subunit 3 family protein [Aureimonas phyllosphaerae]MBB3937981.1 gluconate 2-dehydrogenase gamma chain [Aureimonas phyllosphaerae]MBB3961974.1 gluconate 2-dehydrogenase gamma chain [Aureimonas phyllosphaerae]SFF52841.1 gluconate 2-dehydrogenase gamma chain [Aureimonas phyllosphaerae]
MTNTFFDAHDRATIEAAMARIIPSDDGLPGALEAGCIDFVERYLSGLDYIFAKPDGSGFEILQGRSADAWRQRIEIMRGKYADGIRELDARASVRFAATFKDLSPADQDDILRALEARAAHDLTTLTVSDGLAGPLGEPALQQTSTETDLDFFPLLVAHTRQGFYADPIYGGNRDQVGWQVIGFPGPASLKEVHEGRYTTLQWFAEGEAEKVKEFHDGL